MYILYKDTIKQGTFNKLSQIREYIWHWEEEYYNQDECDINYRPNWEVEELDFELDARRKRKFN